MAETVLFEIGENLYCKHDDDITIWPPDLCPQSLSQILEVREALLRLLFWVFQSHAAGYPSHG